ncbi:MAG: hypothetical protein RMK43_09220 [Cyclobacteriaceae bacterium]|nr:hypothetical protein [Cyclobacteriaceae bacterium]
MLRFKILFFVLLPTLVRAQSDLWWTNLAAGDMPAKILSARTAVLYPPSLSDKELNDIHQSLIRTGIDAVAYVEQDRVFASEDVTEAFANYFVKREIVNLIFISFRRNKWILTVTDFSGKLKRVDTNQTAWHTEDTQLSEVLSSLYRTAMHQYKRQNWLLIEFPERITTVPLIAGNRNERFAYDLKVDGLAVEKTGDAALDAALEEMMKYYPFKYQLVNRNTPETELRRLGLSYVLRFIHARNFVVRELLGYTLKPGENAFVSVTFPNGQEQIKTLPADAYVYKVYVRHIDFGHVFLGPKWDADTTWQQALKNFIYGLRNDMRIN